MIFTCVLTLVHVRLLLILPFMLLKSQFTEDLAEDPSAYGCPQIEGINPSIVYLKRPPVPFVISFAGKLPHNVTSGTAEFVNLEDVPVKKDDDCLFGRAVPTSPRAGVFKVRVYSQDKCFLGETEIIYLEIIEEVLAQAVKTPAILGKVLEAASRRLKEDSGGTIANTQKTSKVGFSSEWKSSLSVQLIQRLVYTAAKVDALWLIKIIFNLPAGRIVFDSYRSRSLLPEYVAIANGHKEIAQYLQDVTKRFSTTEEARELQSSIDWQEIIAAIEATQDQRNLDGEVNEADCRGDAVFESEEWKLGNPPPSNSAELDICHTGIHIKKPDVFLTQDIEVDPSSRPSLPKSCLPPKVPHFTGRQKECEEIIGHVASGSTRIVSIWGSPGFGKTSVAIAVGHLLHSQGLPVYYLSLRGLHSSADLASKLLSLFRRPVASEQQNQEHPSIDFELSHLFSELSEPFTIILDNADELLSGEPKVKEDFTHFLAEIIRQNEKLTFVITTGESLEFMNVQVQGHQSVRISPLNETSSQDLINELLPNAAVSDYKRVSKISGHVPLAMKLLCSFISEDDAEPNKVLDDFMGSFQNQNIVEMLDNRDDRSNLRLKLLFDSSFQRLSAQEKEALVSLCVLPESFDLTVAAAVLGVSQISVVKKVLHSLQRKSLLESGSKPETFLMHQLILSFAKQREETGMKEELLKSKARLCAFYVSRLENLNKQFLTGHSMSAFIDFYEDEQSITRSLIEGSSESEAAKDVFEVLVNANVFLYSLYRGKSATFCKIYDSAKKAAKMLENKNFYKQLLVSEAFYQVSSNSGTRVGLTQLLSKARDVEELHSPVSDSDRGKRLCYNGIYQLANGKTEDGVQCLEDALSLMNSSPEQRILRLIAFQILAIYHRFKKNSSGMSLFYSKALQECKELGDTKLLVIPDAAGKESPETTKEDLSQRNPNASNNQPLKYEIISIVKAATKQLCDDDTKQSLKDATLNIVEEIKKPTLQSSLGLFNFQTNVMMSLSHWKDNQVAAQLSASKISFQETTLQKSKTSKEKYTGQEKNLTSPGLNQEEELAKRYSKGASIHYNIHNYIEAPKFEKRALELRVRRFGEEHQNTADSYHSLGDKQHALGDFSSALQSTRRALNIRLQLFGEEHPNTADSYHSLGLIQHKQGDFVSALQSTQRALNIRLQLFGEEHPSTADSYHSLGITQHKLGDFSSALQSKQRVLNIRLKLFGEEHPSTAHSYHSLGDTQHAIGNFSSALQSKQHALYIRLKLFGEEHPKTADTYHSLGDTHHALGDFVSALQSKQRALDITLKLFGEQHSSTAHSYHSLGDTQHALGDFSSALQSTQHALNIRLQLYGEEHSSTADSYHSLSLTQQKQGDFVSALQSTQRALNIRLKLFGEEHPSTTYSYQSLGITQKYLGDFVSAIHSTQHALCIRLKLFGEENSNTADSYHALGVAQHKQGDFVSALQSTQRALNVRLQLFGEEHSSTADSYYSLGVRQHKLGDFSSALQSKQRALNIRLKLFGEEHSSTADSYQSLGITQYKLADFSSALHSTQRALCIRLQLFGEEHSSTADSYHSLGVTQHKLGDVSSALQSKQRALNIRLKLFGEEHPSTADSYQSLGITQHKLCDFSSALHSTQRALCIRLKLFGEEHSSTASSYHSLRFTQHAQGDYSSALQSARRALDIRLKLFGEDHLNTAGSRRLLQIAHMLLTLKK